MFSELPKLLGRDFAIGFFLPAAIFTLALLGLGHGFDLDVIWLPRLQAEVLDVALLALTAWLWAVLLLGLNRSIYQLLEGYGEYNPIRWALMKLGWEKQRYRRLIARIRELDDALRKAALTPEENAERATLMRWRAEQFPKEPYLMPTRFGNSIRAFETYSFEMYGLDDIPGWLRLIAVIPKDYLAIVGDAKAQTDFWMNLWVQSFLLIVAYFATALAAWQGPDAAAVLPPLVWFPFACWLLAWFAAGRARVAAVEWGQMVRAAYDVHLPELREKLGFAAPADRKQERKMWEEFSRSIVYRDPRLIPRSVSARSGPSPQVNRPLGEVSGDGAAGAPAENAGPEYPPVPTEQDQPTSP